MKRINLQGKTKAQPGKAEKYWFRNERIGLENTLFHRIYIPLEPFDSGLKYEDQPVETEIVIEWLKLDLVDPDNLDGIEVSNRAYEDAEASIYIGHAHNICDIKKLTFKRIEKDIYQVTGDIVVDFENEGVAQNESFSFQTMIKYER